MITSIPCYDIFELPLSGPQDGNPFTDVTLSARFQNRNRVLEPEGFYDGDGRYLIHLMPDEACYEGDIPDGWGNISAQEMVHLPTILQTSLPKIIHNNAPLSVIDDEMTVFFDG